MISIPIALQCNLWIRPMKPVHLLTVRILKVFHLRLISAMLVKPKEVKTCRRWNVLKMTSYPPNQDELLEQVQLNSLKVENVFYGVGQLINMLIWLLYIPAIDTRYWFLTFFHRTVSLGSSISTVLFKILEHMFIAYLWIYIATIKLYWSNKLFCLFKCYCCDVNVSWKYKAYINISYPDSAREM